MDKIVNTTLFVLLFFASYVFTSSPVDFYVGYIGMFILFPRFIPKYGVPKILTLVYTILIISGLLSLYAGQNTSSQFYKILIGTFSAYLFFYYVFQYYQGETDFLLKFYLKASFWLVIIGIIQFISFQIGFKPGYNYLWILNKWKVTEGGNLGIRINSLFIEPTYYATFLSPALFFAILKVMKKQVPIYTFNMAIVFIIGYVLSFSGVGFLGLFLILLFIALNFGFIRYSLIGIGISFFLFNFINENVEEFRTRYEGTTNVFSQGQFKLGQTHGSSIILYNNYHIATENFKRNPFFGTGLGSHPTAYDKYSLTKQFEETGISLNKQDANSMFLRLMSETGLFGMGLFIWVIFAFMVRRKRGDNEIYWITSMAMLVCILLNLFRQGNYFLNGFPFYVWMYYFNYKNYQSYLSNLNNKDEAKSPLAVLHGVS